MSHLVRQQHIMQTILSCPGVTHHQTKMSSQQVCHQRAAFAHLYVHIVKLRQLWCHSALLALRSITPHCAALLFSFKCRSTASSERSCTSLASVTQHLPTLTLHCSCVFPILQVHRERAAAVQAAPTCSYAPLLRCTYLFLRCTLMLHCPFLHPAWQVHRQRAAAVQAAPLHPRSLRAVRLLAGKHSCSCLYERIHDIDICMTCVVFIA
jgi:hypothetical protein